MKKLTTGGILLVGLALIGAGCPFTDKVEERVADQVVESMIEEGLEDDGNAGDVEIEDDSFTFTDNESGETFSFGEGAELPENFPSDVPIYEPGTLLGTSSANEDRDFTVSMQTEDGFETVADFYDDEMEAEGWEIDENASFSGSDGKTVSIIGTKDNRRLTVVVFQFSEEQVSVTMSVNTEEDAGSEE